MHRFRITECVEALAKQLQGCIAMAQGGGAVDVMTRQRHYRVNQKGRFRVNICAVSKRIDP